MASRARTRLLVLVAVLAVLLGAAGVSAVRAVAPDALPPIPADELLASSIEAMSAPFSISGDVTSRFDTGLPDLPGALGGTGTGGGSFATLLTGTQHFKVWRSPDGARIARVTDLSEQVVVANHREGWLWDSDGMTAARVDPSTMRSLLRGGEAGAPMAAGVAPTRADLTGWIGDALAALAPFATVSVDADVEVAGRPAYDVVLEPAPGPTLIGRAGVAIDAETRLPLRFSVTPKGSDDPAIEVGFDSVSFDPIDPSMFDFVPPPGARVSEVSAPSSPIGDEHADRDQVPPDVRVFGQGFSARVAIRLSGPVPEEARAFLPYAGPLLSAITVDVGGDSWLLAGPVPVTTLERDADRLP